MFGTARKSTKARIKSIKKAVVRFLKLASGRENGFFATWASVAHSSKSFMSVIAF